MSLSAWVEISGEAPELARAETIAAAETLGGSGARVRPADGVGGLVAVELPSPTAVGELSARLALAHRVLVALAPDEEVASALRREGRGQKSGAVRRLGRPRSGTTDGAVLAAGRAFKDGGGSIDLENPVRKFWLAASASGRDALFEEVGPVDRRALERRRMPSLPFQRPISLPPKFARAAANLAHVRAGTRVLDPFAGTGALLAEAGLLGGSLYGIDLDPAMVRGALRNLAYLGLEAEELVEGDAGSVSLSSSEIGFDAILSDPPYGRSSATGGEDARALVARVVPRWASRVRPGGRIVLVLPGGEVPLEGEWRETLRIPVRVHRSLTRQFRVYERKD